MALIQKYTRTNLYLIDEELWNWAQYKAKTLGKRSIAEYIFELIALDREKELIKT